jgi:IS5 family transposase
LAYSDAKHAPNCNSFWLFRESLKDLKLTRNSVERFNRQLDHEGLIIRKGQLVDASFVKAPVPCNTPDENTRIKAGEAPDDWPENKRRQKET